MSQQDLCIKRRTIVKGLKNLESWKEKEKELFQVTQEERFGHQGERFGHNTEEYRWHHQWHLIWHQHITSKANRS